VLSWSLPLLPAFQDFGGQDWRWQGSKKQRLEPAVPLGRPGVTKDDRKTVFVGNVPFAAGEAELEGFFSRVGQVGCVKLQECC
jgi:hypothetical protein